MTNPLEKLSITDLAIYSSRLEKFMENSNKEAYFSIKSRDDENKRKLHKEEFEAYRRSYFVIQDEISRRTQILHQLLEEF